MRFDSMAPGEGVEVSCRFENGKACLEWKFIFADSSVEVGRKGILRLLMWDRQGNIVLECIRRPEEEEPLRSILLQPHLWNGVEDPYLYTLEAFLMDGEGNCLDSLCRQLALYSLDFRGELFLNGIKFEERAVAYCFPEAKSSAELQRMVAADLQLLRELGANCIYAEKEEGLYKPFLQLCERLGFLVRPLPEDRNQKIPAYRGEACSLVNREGNPKSEFYRYKARWSREPFVYIVPESIHRQESGNFSAVVYSSCGRIALYSNGNLHEFQSGDGEFLFREIPAKSPYLLLTAEGDGCMESLSLHRIFTK